MFRARSIAVKRAKDVLRFRSIVRRAGVRSAYRVARPCFTPDSCSSSTSSVVGRGALQHAATSDGVHPCIGRQHAHSERLSAQEIGEGGKHVSGNPMHPVYASDEPRLGELFRKLENLGGVDAGDRSKEALRLLGEARKEGLKDLRAYNTVLRSLSGQATNEVVQGLVEQIREDGLELDVTSYNYVIYGYAFCKDLPGAVRTYEEMASNKIAPDRWTLSNMVIAYSWGSFEDMMRVLGELRAKNWTPSRAAYHSMIPAMRRANNCQGIYDAMHCLMKERRAPNDPAFAFGFWAARQLRDPDFAKMLLKMRSTAGFPPRQDFFVNVMVTLREAGRHEEVMGYWRQLVCVNGLGDVKILPETFTMALKSAAKTRQWDEAEAILAMMQVHGVPRTEQTYLGLIGVPGDGITKVDAERVGRMLAADDWEGDEGDAKLSPEVRSRLAVVYVVAKLYDKALPLFQAAVAANVKMNPSTKESYVRTLLELERFGELKEMWDSSSLKERKRYKEGVYQHMMRAAERVGDVEWASDLQSAALVARKKTKHWFHPAVITMLTGAGRLEEAAAVLTMVRSHGHPKLQPASYHTLIRCCKDEGNTALAVRVAQDMRGGAVRYVPYPGAVHFMIGAFIEHGRPSEVMEMFRELCAHNRQPGAECYVLMADAALEANDRAAAIEYCAAARERGLVASDRAVAFSEGRVVGTEDCTSQTSPTRIGGEVRDDAADLARVIELEADAPVVAERTR